jgi:hypothetical protein
MECRTGVEKELLQMNEKYLIRRDDGILVAIDGKNVDWVQPV